MPDRSLAIVGYGRFGKLLAQLAASRFTVSICETSTHNKAQAELDGFPIIQPDQLDQVSDIALAVPISAFESVVRGISHYITSQHLVVDVCSVKTHPVAVMTRYLPHARVLATHPMFGPDSSKKGFAGLTVAFCPVSTTPADEQLWRDFWASTGVEVLTTTPEQHDQDVAYSQALTYSIAHIMNGMGIPAHTFTTRSSVALADIARYSANDSAQLYHDMLAYNPYAAGMLERLEDAAGRTFAVANAVIGEGTAH